MNAVLPMAASATGRIGPNAITRVAEALPGLVGVAGTLQLFERAGLAGYLRQPPQTMVDEHEVTRLHRELRLSLGPDLARQVARQAGRLTADYLLANRIPKPAQALLKVLPARLAARVLLASIRGHSWTFAGSGVFRAELGWIGGPVRLAIRGNPLCRGVLSTEPACDFYAATFERLFRVLVHPAARVIETHCEARGDPECRFEIRWAS
jgi:divinyl protochlorophyllide a 8-vinyl-reductase